MLTSWIYYIAGFLTCLTLLGLFMLLAMPPKASDSSDRVHHSALRKACRRLATDWVLTTVGQQRASVGLLILPNSATKHLVVGVVGEAEEVIRQSGGPALIVLPGRDLGELLDERDLGSEVHE